MKKPLIALLIIAAQFAHAGESNRSRVVEVEKVESQYKWGACDPNQETCTPIFIGTRIWYMCDDGKTNEMYWNDIPVVVSKGDKLELKEGSCTILKRLHGRRFVTQ